ncbi:hypothetical protein ACFQ9U_01515 [Streptomyces sp. NPDC056568]|uniref:hypothetical protein n=1 Tax=Streptomyces sp. NPDC056568 TaxID=3345866 RepID=UPI00369F701F
MASGSSTPGRERSVELSGAHVRTTGAGVPETRHLDTGHLAGRPVRAVPRCPLSKPDGAPDEGRTR